MKDVIEQEITFLLEQIRTLQRTRAAIDKQILHFETRIQDLRRAASQ